MGLHDERIEPEGRRWQRHYWRGKCPVQAVELALIQYGPQVQIEIVSQGLELVLTALLLPFICGEVALDAGMAMIWVFPMTMLVYAVAKYIAVRRYR